MRAFLSASLGVLVSLPGIDQSSGNLRLTFGFEELSGGFKLLPVLIGMFAVSQIIKDLSRLDEKITIIPVKKTRDLLFSLTDWKNHAVNLIRSAFIGTSIGVLPGIGANISSMAAYSAARSLGTPEEKAKFGKGSEIGIVASETANNAATGAAMIPLLALGLPGGALTAMMVGVFQMHDMEPGPLVFINSADLVWVVFAAMFYANLSIILVGYLETKTIINRLRIPFQFLAPMILLLATVGAYAVRGLTIDVVVMFLAGVIGFFLRRSGYSVAGIVLGLILGKIGEQTFAQAMQMLHFEWSGYFDRPIAPGLLIAGMATLLGSIYGAFFKKKQSPPMAI